MKVIKRFWAPIFIVCFLLLGYVIGQVRNSIKAEGPSTEVSDGNEVGTESNIDTGNEWNSINLVFENSNTTTDNPWGYTAGLIDVDERSCVLLTPNTDVIMYPKEDRDSFGFDTYIHPWVSDSSDGAGLVIWYLDENDALLGQEEISVAADGEKTGIGLNTDRFHGTNHFKILCNNGGNDDDSGDWVIITAQ